MGGRSATPEEYRAYYRENAHIGRATNAQQVFTAYRMNPAFDPSKIKLPREARDSAESPHSRGIILAEDVTGSMGRYLLSLIKEEFPRLIKLVYESVSFNPHIMFMGVGDVEYDVAPLQVTQFETDLRILDQLQSIFLERGGGPNSYESYTLPWYFAAKHTSMDCYEKRGEKGFIFTFGDEKPNPFLTSSHISKVFGENSSIDKRKSFAMDCLEMATEKFNCYHIILHGTGYYSGIVTDWRNLMGGNACDLSDHTKIPELITTILCMYEGMSKTEAISQIQDEYTRGVIKEALIAHDENVIIPKFSKDSKTSIEVF